MLLYDTESCMALEWATMTDGTLYVFERDEDGRPQEDTLIMWDGPVVEL